MTIIEQIKAEIERQMKFYYEKEMDALDDSEQGDEDALWYQGHRKMCEKLLSFISTLEEAASKCKGCNNVKGCVTCVNGDQWAHYEESENPVPKDLEEAADEMAIRAFPEKKSYSTVIDRVVDYNAVDRKNYREGIIAGAKLGAEHLKKKDMNEMKDAMEAHYPEKYEKILLSLHHVMNCADAQNAVKRDGLELEDVCDFLFSLKLNRKLDKKIPYQKELEEYAITGGFAYVDNIIDKGHTNKWCADDVEQAYHDGIIAGSEWQKEQMMNEAVAVEVVGDKRDLRLIDSTQRCMFNAKRGDWLKIIIVKED